MLDEKAQLHTLEGVAAATIMLLVIVYAIDSTSITPVTSSTANMRVETELQVLGQDILSALDYAEPGNDSKLKNDILGWDGREYVWNGTNYYDNLTMTNTLNNSLTKILNATLVGQGIAHNVNVTFLDNGTLSLNSSYMIYNGEPSNNAVIVSRKIALHNSDIYNTTNPIKDKDIDPSTNLHNIVDVRLVLWRM